MKAELTCGYCKSNIKIEGNSDTTVGMQIRDWLKGHEACVLELSKPKKQKGFQAWPDTWPIPGDKGQAIQTCPKCGIKLEGVMGYVCSQNPCPTGLGGSFS